VTAPASPQRSCCEDVLRNKNAGETPAVRKPFLPIFN
jgi:hypothetical protein